MLKKGETGISSLLLMIAIIAIVSLVIFTYMAATNKLQEQGYKNADKTKSYITTKIKACDLNSEYEHRLLKRFTVVVKPSPGSGSIYINSTIITLSTDDEKTTLKYAGTAAENNHSYNGYYTLGHETYDVPSSLNDDIDMDGSLDRLSLDANGSVILNLSSEGAIILGNCSGPTTFNAFSFSSSYVESVTGTCSGGTVSNVTILPTKIGSGYFTVEYMIKSSNHLAGRLDRGEVVKVYFESQNGIGNDQEGVINFILKAGSETELRFHTPDVETIGTVSLSHY